MYQTDSNPGPHDHHSNTLTTRLPTAAAESTDREILAIYALTLLMYIVASPDLDPNPRGVNYLTLRVQFYANECKEGRDADP